MTFRAYLVMTTITSKDDGKQNISFGIYSEPNPTRHGTPIGSTTEQRLVMETRASTYHDARAQLLSIIRHIQNSTIE
jgi:hypothetical protein